MQIASFPPLPLRKEGGDDVRGERASVCCLSSAKAANKDKRFFLTDGLARSLARKYSDQEPLSNPGGESEEGGRP